MILVITTNTNLCRMYAYDKTKPHLKLLKEINHPENKLRNVDLGSDRPGHYQGSVDARGAYSSRSEMKDVEIDNFSRELAKELNQGRNSHLYDKVILIAPPHMYGLLSQHLNKHVKDLIVNTVQKDIIHLPEHELLEFLKMNTRYPD